MHIAEVVTIAKSLPLLRLNTYKSLILSYSADYRRILGKKLHGKGGPGALSAISRLSFVRILSFHYFPDNCLFMRKNGYFCKVLGLGKTNGHFV